MFTKQFLAVAASIAAAIAAAGTNFDAGANTNMAVYWGQGPNQQRLAHFCADSSIDVIPIAFLNVFPDQVNGGYPGTNFGNQCGSETFKNKDGSDSPLLSNCPLIGPDIKTCQAMGKKILLSLGGAIPTNQSIKNDESAVAFAKFVWNAFGPEDATYHGPRPFGNAVVDGFDFDIESAVSDNDAASQYRGYGTMIDTLRVLYATDTKNEYYISGAPQCVIPDAHLAHPIETSWFDFLFIQFYNTPQCSARAYFDSSYGRVGDKPSSISFDAWVGFVRTTAMNKDVKLYIGLPAAPLTALAYDTKMYIAPDDVVNLIDLFQCRYPKEFGGIMVFEATYSEQNLIDNKPFVDVVKGQLIDNKCAKPVTLTSSTVSSTPTSSSSSSSISSTKVTSSPISTSASSAALHNSTFTAGPTAPIGTGSSSIPSYNTTGIWNGTSTSITLAGMGSSSIPSYTTSTGIGNGTLSSTTLVGTGSSSIPYHPTTTGIWNGTTSSVPSGTGYTSSSVPVNSTTSTRSSISTNISLQPTGGLGGSSSFISTTSVRYPVNNSTSSSTVSASGGVIYTAETITITKCPTEVTSCPVRTSITIYPVTSSSSIPVVSSSSGPFTSAPTDKISSVFSHGGVTTLIVTSYVTTCPMTNTITTGGSTSIQTTSTLSTVTSTITSVISSTPNPAPTSITSKAPETAPAAAGHESTPLVSTPPAGHGGSPNAASPSSSSGNSPVGGSGSRSALQPEQPAHGGSSTPAHGGSSIPVQGGSSNSGSSQSGGNANSPVGGGKSPSSPSGGSSKPYPPPSSNAGSSPSQPKQPAQPAHGSPSPGPSPSGDNANNPVGGSKSPSSPNGGSSNPYSPPSSNAGNSPSQPEQPPHGSSFPASNTPPTSGNTSNNPVNGGSNSPPQGSPAAEGLTTIQNTSTKFLTSTIPSGPVNSGIASSIDSTSLPIIITQTLVPIPLSPEQTAHPAGPASSGPGENSPVQASPVPSSAPFPARNGTASATAGGPTGSSVLASSAGGTGTFSPPGNVTPFTGGASKMMMGSSFVGLAAVVVVGAILM
ncbi:MAG: hypothetical protein Q9213_000645 [Squamulea squamosa]